MIERLTASNRINPHNSIYSQNIPTRVVPARTKVQHTSLSMSPSRRLHLDKRFHPRYIPRTQKGPSPPSPAPVVDAQNSVERLSLIILSSQDTPLEKFIWDVSSLPVIPPGDIDSPYPTSKPRLTRVELRMRWCRNRRWK